MQRRFKTGQHPNDKKIHRMHVCNWPKCHEFVPPAKWGCMKHWLTLPVCLRNDIWEAYTPGQEFNKEVPKEYARVMEEVKRWVGRRS